MNRFLVLFSFILVLASANSCFAMIDRALIESKKCSSLFPYFEKKNSLPADSLHSISIQETGKKHPKHNLRIVWPWTVNVEGKGYYFQSMKEAIEFTQEQLVLGRTSIDVGCMQISLKHHAKAFSSLEQAFNPRENIAYGAKFLKEKFNNLGSWTKAIGHYHSATPEKAHKYQTSVSKIASNMPKYKHQLREIVKSSMNYYSIAADEKRLKSPIMVVNNLESHKSISRKKHFVQGTTENVRNF